MTYFNRNNVGLLAAACAMLMLSAGCDQQTREPIAEPDAEQLNQLRADAANYGTLVRSGTATRGDSVQYLLQSLTAAYVEPGYFPERISAERIRRSEQLAASLGKNGGGLSKDDLKQIAFEIGTPFFAVVTQDGNRQITALNLSQIPFYHIAHLQPIMVSYSFTTPTGLQLVQMVLPGSAEVIQTYLSALGYDEDILDAVSPSSGKVMKDLAPWEVANCKPGERWHYISHPDYGLFPSCSVTVESEQKRPGFAPLIDCPGCSNSHPGPVWPIDPEDEWAPRPAGAGPVSGSSSASGAFRVEPVTDIVVLRPDGSKSLQLLAPRGPGEGASYVMESGIGYQIAAAMKGADIRAVNVTSARSTATMNRNNLVSTTGITVNVGASVDPKTIGLDFGYKRETSATLMSDVPVYENQVYDHPARIRDVYTKTARFACWGRTIETQLRLRNGVDVKYYYETSGVKHNIRSNEMEERSINVPCYYMYY